ncbi:proteoglycan 4-like [Sardina pilchardus]|uniref:proteoglycan 4-like n=1 Tax=Sardina pilchardus TaxID=27697 RepID=UPI002E12AE5B
MYWILTLSVWTLIFHLINGGPLPQHETASPSVDHKVSLIYPHWERRHVMVPLRYPFVGIRRAHPVLVKVFIRYEIIVRIPQPPTTPKPPAPSTPKPPAPSPPKPPEPSTPKPPAPSTPKPLAPSTPKPPAPSTPKPPAPSTPKPPAPTPKPPAPSTPLPPVPTTECRGDCPMLSTV